MSIRQFLFFYCRAATAFFTFNALAVVPLHAHPLSATPASGAAGTTLPSSAPAAVTCPDYLPEGSTVQNPPQTSSRLGVLKTTLVAHNRGSGPLDNSYDYRFCLLENDIPLREAPVLRVNPGDTIELTVKNAMQPESGYAQAHFHSRQPCNPDASPPATMVSTNLHYHGLNIPPSCQQDNILDTLIQPAPASVSKAAGATRISTPAAHSDKSPSYTYRMKIPANEPPGLYWYHPHIHGVAEPHLLGGMSGALIIEGMEKFYPEIKAMPEKIILLRDSDKTNPSKAKYARPDEPWKNVNINHVSVNYGDLTSPIISMPASERQFWRVANLAADTHFILEYQIRKQGESSWIPQPLQVIAIDGVPFLDGPQVNGKYPSFFDTRIVFPTGGRAEFIVQAPPAGYQARLYSADYNVYLDGQSAGCAPDFPEARCDSTNRNPARILATIDITPPLLPPPKAVSQPVTPLRRFSNLHHIPAKKVRTLFFTKNPANGADMFITVNGSKPEAFNPEKTDIVVQGPTVEDWIIENRDNESHDFHIHQVHFAVMARNGVPADGKYRFALRDSVQLGSCRQWVDGINPQTDPYGLQLPENDPRHDGEFTGKNCKLPATVRLRMDFRDRDITGKLVYHCHILQHEDRGMMRVMELR